MNLCYATPVTCTFLTSVEDFSRARGHLSSNPVATVCGLAFQPLRRVNPL